MIKRASGGLSSFLKSRWRTSLKDQQPQKRENTPEDIERDWIKHQGLHFAFHGDFKAPIERLLKAGGSEILEVGCGAGFWTDDMASEFPISYFTGIDVDKKTLPASGLPKNTCYLHVDLTELPLPFEDNTFDYIFIRSMIDTLPDELWHSVLTDLVRIMKKGGYIECMESYDRLFDIGPIMTTITELIQVGPVPESPGTKNPWPNRIANLSQLMGMQIYHVHTPIGLGGDTIGSLFLEYWERLIQSYQKEWISSKLITEQQAEQFLDNLAEEVNKHNTFMSWYSVVARKKGYSGPTIQFDDVDDNNNLHTTVYE